MRLTGRRFFSRKQSCHFFLSNRWLMHFGIPATIALFPFVGPTTKGSQPVNMNELVTASSRWVGGCQADPLRSVASRRCCLLDKHQRMADTWQCYQGQWVERDGPGNETTALRRSHRCQIVCLFALFGISGWGLGFAMTPSSKGVIYSHAGNNLGYTSGFAFNKEAKFGYVFFTNSDQRSDLHKKLDEWLIK